MKNFVTAVTIALSLCVLNPAHAQSVSKEIQSELDLLGKKSFGCSKILKRFKTFRREYTQFHFFFAGRKDDTVTGIRGCGYGFNIDPEKAQADALKHCKKWEVTYGTDNGTKVCQFMK